MMDCLPMGADGGNVLRLALRLAYDLRAELRKVLAQCEVQLANLGYRPVKAQMQNASPHGRREGLMRMCQHACAQLAPAPRDFRHHRINTVRRGAGHQADNELRGVFGLALNSHSPNLAKTAKANKPCIVRTRYRLLLGRGCAVLKG